MRLRIPRRNFYVYVWWIPNNGTQIAELDYECSRHFTFSAAKRRANYENSKYPEEVLKRWWHMAQMGPALENERRHP